MDSEDDEEEKVNERELGSLPVKVPIKQVKVVKDNKYKRHLIMYIPEVDNGLKEFDMILFAETT